MNLLRVWLFLTTLILSSYAAVEISKVDDEATKATVAPSQKNISESKTRIIVIVNNDVITAADVEERIRLINLTAGNPVNAPISNDVRKKIIEEIIHEHLQLQAAQAKKIKIADVEVDKSLEHLALENKMSLAAMLNLLKSHGISKQTMMVRTRAQMSWGRYIREMYGALVHISDQEVDKMLSKAQEVKIEKPSQDLMEVTLCQAIFDLGPGTPDEVKALLEPKIEEIQSSKGCASFISAANGYGIKKVDKNRVVKFGNLPDGLKEMVHKTKPGTCMQPAMTPDGLVLTMVCSKVMPKILPPPAPTRDMALQAVEQEKLGKRAAQEMIKLKSAAFIEWK